MKAGDNSVPGAEQDDAILRWLQKLTRHPLQHPPTHPPHSPCPSTSSAKKLETGPHSSWRPNRRIMEGSRRARATSFWPSSRSRSCCSGEKWREMRVILPLSCA